ncbi:MAG: hypothetical protein J6I50_10595 [Clostridia bacterium]|nr:hypothetical protein [Clostridia bacterium]
MVIIMSKPDYQHFLSVLEKKEKNPRPTLFEPFINDTLAEQLIWRRGPQLWDTPEHYADTMISLRERTKADVVILDARRFCVSSLSRMLAAAESSLPDGAALVVLCGKKETQRIAETSPAVCAVGGYEECRPHQMPFIRMDHTPEYALEEHADGWYAKGNAAALFHTWQETPLCIVGGLDAAWCATAEPLQIYRSAQKMMAETENCGWMLGSGGEIAAHAYLSLISLLGIYARYH